MARLRLLRFWRSVTLRVRGAVHAVSHWAITAFGVALFIWITRSTQLPVDSQRFAMPLYAGAATLIGTMVALAVNLSLIPVQRAADRYASAVLRLFREDAVTTGLIVLLSCFSVLLFALAVRGLLVGQPPGWPGLPLAVVAAAFDVMRWHHRRTTRLLDPWEAISRLTARATGMIDDLQHNIARGARLLRRSMPQQQRDAHAVEDVELRIYLGDRSHKTNLLHWLDSLTEIALKALDRGDDLATRQAASAIAGVAAHYLVRRKNNLQLRPVDLHSLESDGFEVLTPALESLNQLVLRAVSKKHEGVATAAIRSLTDLTLAVAALDGRPFEDRRGALAYLPLGYLTGCIRSAQRGGLTESALEGSRSLLRLATALPPQVGIIQAHVFIIHAWREIALGFLAAGQGEIARDPIGNLVRINWVLLKQDHWQLDECLAQSLGELTALAPIVFEQETRAQAAGLVRLPLSTAYDLASEYSLPYFVEVSARRARKDDDRPWVDPYSKFTRVNEVIWRHLRELAQTPGCGSSGLMFYLGKMVAHCAEVYGQLLAKPLTDDKEQLSKLAHGVSWYVSCLWVAFQKTPSAKELWAESVVDEVTVTAMHYCDAGFDDITTSCAAAIRTIAESLVKAGCSPHYCANLLMGIWKVRLLADARGRQTTVEAMDRLLVPFPDVPEDRWNAVVGALESHKRRLDRELLDTRIDAARLAMSEDECLIIRARRDAEKGAP